MPKHLITLALIALKQSTRILGLIALNYKDLKVNFKVAKLLKNV